MNDYIKRSDVLEAFSNLQPSGFEHSLAGIVAINTVKAVPAADAVPVAHGHWVAQNEWYETVYSCSNCSEEFLLEEGNPESNGYFFCPHCGAKMDEVSK